MAVRRSGLVRGLTCSPTRALGAGTSGVRRCMPEWSVMWAGCGMWGGALQPTRHAEVSLPSHAGARRALRSIGRCIHARLRCVSECVASCALGHAGRCTPLPVPGDMSVVVVCVGRAYLSCEDLDWWSPVLSSLKAAGGTHPSCMRISPLCNTRRSMFTRRWSFIKTETRGLATTADWAVYV